MEELLGIWREGGGRLCINTLHSEDQTAASALCPSRAKDVSNITMSSLIQVGWCVLCFLVLWDRQTVLSKVFRCTAPHPISVQHPVHGLLEKFKAGPGCAAHEHKNKETHVVAVGRSTESPTNKVTLLLKTSSLMSSSTRSIHLVLSSKLPITWWVEPVRLPANLSLQVQVSSNSTVKSHAVHLNVQKVPSLPFLQHALHRWVLKQHSTLSSFIHTMKGNQAYVQLDPTLPSVCRLQPVFLHPNYMTSDLQPQEVHGCSRLTSGWEVHVIKLHSAGSGLCGSLQVEVIVTLVSNVSSSRTQRIVLILSSAVPVNWAIAAPGVRGHVTVHSSNSVSPPYPPEPDLTVSTSLSSNLSTSSDLLMWAEQSGYTDVTSYTEAMLANRFVIQLSESGAVTNHEVSRPSWTEERRLRWRLNRGGRAKGSGGRHQSLTVDCGDGRLSVTLDGRILQKLLFPVFAVTLRDLTCQADFNGSHFLLAFPVISCGTEGLLLPEPRGVQYNNTVLLWKDKPLAALNKSKSPLSIHISCFADSHSTSVSVDDDDDVDDDVAISSSELRSWKPEGPKPGPVFLNPPPSESTPVLLLKLFITENFELTRSGPCVVTADHRVYVEISAKTPLAGVVRLRSCIVSPLSDPKKTSFWTVISDGCSSDASLTLSTAKKPEKKEHRASKQEVGSDRRRGEEETPSIRFSFILRPVFNDSLQFLHCSLQLCGSGSFRGKHTGSCTDRLSLPLLVSAEFGHHTECEVRNLSRPMVVTRPISSLVPKSIPSAGQRMKRLSVALRGPPEPDPSRTSMVQMGPVVGIVFVAFVLGVCLSHRGAAFVVPRQSSSLRNSTESLHPECNITICPVLQLSVEDFLVQI
ncbi:transforming growth factor beta receptor type 3 isoform X4 [Gouania willdenowi]|uniref:transforming growth factor beta receptor type 3 isoform X4 n=1 Tax=Gouania willdenowi TaxID=441366 RepID=UPI00105472A4|nr:transforming growth factor beta receptor type 3-like isoform X4 [Gouania willdenowi]